VNYIIHDIDRDGWGSAALVVAEKHPENCLLYPTREKDISGVLRSIRPKDDDSIWVLDIPAPESWTDFPIRKNMTWVDHHMES